MLAKPMKTLELRYLMIQCLIIKNNFNFIRENTISMKK